MDFIFEIIVELILTLIVEGGVEASTNSRIPKFVRIPLLIIFGLGFLVIVFGLIIMGILTMSDNKVVEIFFIGLGIFFAVAISFQIRKKYKERINRQ